MKIKFQTKSTPWWERECKVLVYDKEQALRVQQQFCKRNSKLSAIPRINELVTSITPIWIYYTPNTGCGYIEYDFYDTNKEPFPAIKIVSINKILYNEN